MTTHILHQPQTVLDFWFPPQKSLSELRSQWFGKSEDLDQKIIQQFKPWLDPMTRGDLNSWLKTPQGTLAFIILADQFPRHIYRDSPQAYDYDSLALHTTLRALDKGFDQKLTPLQRTFFYLPLEHSENLEHQQQSVELFEKLKQQEQDLELQKVLENSLLYAQKHLEVIQKFGRFPHRNKILNRSNTPQEDHYLAQPGSGF